jgi:hypothetical protein
MRLALLALAVVIPGGAGLWALVTTAGATPLTCPWEAVDSATRYEGHGFPWLFVFATLAFTMGSQLNRFRASSTAHDAAGERRRRRAVFLRWFVTVGLGGIAAALLYESMAVTAGDPAPAGGHWPITYYVRCAYSSGGAVEAAVWVTTLAASVLFGHWLWAPPPRSPRP